MLSSLLRISKQEDGAVDTISGHFGGRFPAARPLPHFLPSLRRTPKPQGEQDAFRQGSILNDSRSQQSAGSSRQNGFHRVRNTGSSGVRTTNQPGTRLHQCRSLEPHELRRRVREESRRRGSFASSAFFTEGTAAPHLLHERALASGAARDVVGNRGFAAIAAVAYNGAESR